MREGEARAALRCRLKGQALRSGLPREEDGMDGGREKGEREEKDSFFPMLRLDTRRGTNSLQIKGGDVGNMQQRQSCSFKKSQCNDLGRPNTTHGLLQLHCEKRVCLAYIPGLFQPRKRLSRKCVCAGWAAVINVSLRRILRSAAQPRS